MTVTGGTGGITEREGRGSPRTNWIDAEERDLVELEVEKWRKP